MTTYDLAHHGDAEVADGLLDYAVNVRLTGPPRWLRDRLAAALDTLGAYPDGRAAASAVARRYRRPVLEVLLTAGAAEAFVLLARALTPRRAVCVHPSFTEPEAALRAAGLRVERVTLPPPYRLNPALVPDDADLVILGNPTNPTGVLHPPEVVLSLARPGRILLVDEAFADTVPGEPASVAAASGVPGLVVLRSLTKTWGLAGLRVGYLLAAPEIVRRLAAAQPLWPVSALALTALQACMTPAAVAEAAAAAEALAGHRRHLLAGLRRLPQVAVAAESSTSFLLLQVPDGSAVRKRLRAGGVAVRRGDTFPGLGGDHLRVAVRAPERSDLLVAALAAAVRAGQPTGQRI